MFAADSGHGDCLEMLIEAGANLDLVNKVRPSLYSTILCYVINIM